MTRAAEQVVLQPAYVLHGRPYRETSQLLDIFTAEYGRISVVARGVRGGKSTRAALLQPFRPLLVSWLGRGGLATLRDVEPSGRALTLTGNPLMSGFYLNELLQRLLTPDDPHVSLFNQYDMTLRGMAVTSHAMALENLLRQFELQLLDALGYGLHLDAATGHAGWQSRDGYYQYFPEQGMMQVEMPQRSAAAVRGSTLQVLAAEASLVGAGLREAKQLMRSVLAHHLGPKPLRSRELMRQVGVIVNTEN